MNPETKSAIKKLAIALFLFSLVMLVLVDTYKSTKVTCEETANYCYYKTQTCSQIKGASMCTTHENVVDCQDPRATNVGHTCVKR